MRNRNLKKSCIKIDANSLSLFLLYASLKCMEHAYIYKEGKILSAENAHISLFDLSFLRGFGVFDYLRIYQKVPFHLFDHLIRFQKSAEAIGLKLPLSLEEIETIVEKLLKYVPYSDANIKLFLTGGVSNNHYLPQKNPTFLSLIYPFFPFPKSLYEKGVSLLSQIYERPFPTSKTLYYLPAIASLCQNKKKHADDVLFLSDQEEILEAGTANFFAIRENQILTPKRKILQGITRQIVIDLMRRKKVEVIETSLFFNELKTFEGIFLTSSSKEIVPVSKIDDHEIPFHPLIKRVQDAFVDYVQTQVNFVDSLISSQNL